jgi:proteasome assembly chaperone 3
VSEVIDKIQTDISIVNFSDKILVTISQAGRLAHWVHVPLAAAAADPMGPGPLVTESENELLPMTHLTATTILGGTKRDDEIIGQTLATTIASAILLRNNSEERLLVVGLGLEPSLPDQSIHTRFEQIVGLVLDII